MSGSAVIGPITSNPSKPTECDWLAGTPGSATAATAGSAVETRRTSAGCAGQGTPDIAPGAAVEAASAERAAMGAEPASAARQYDGRIETGRAGRNRQGPGLADGEQRRGGGDDETGELHGDSFVMR